jgi:hypothetical protein
LRANLLIQVKKMIKGRTVMQVFRRISERFPKESCIPIKQHLGNRFIKTDTIKRRKNAVCQQLSQTLGKWFYQKIVVNLHLFRRQLSRRLDPVTEG